MRHANIFFNPVKILFFLALLTGPLFSLSISKDSVFADGFYSIVFRDSVAVFNNSAGLIHIDSMPLLLDSALARKQFSIRLNAGVEQVRLEHSIYRCSGFPSDIYINANQSLKLTQFGLSRYSCLPLKAREIQAAPYDTLSIPVLICSGPERDTFVVTGFFDSTTQHGGTQSSLSFTNTAFDVSPNPFSSSTVITLGKNRQATSISIYSIRGEEVLKAVPPFAGNVVFAPPPSAGHAVYLVRARYGNVCLSKRIVRCF